ncbi:MAG TPA: hypothetical protein VMR99_01660 [Candidatus Paceibacterota bacterium]|nr:hypothetical protein [Candidatus Paceibacterota bacterium]
MKLFDSLKQFKTIKPDAEFTQRSRTEILLSPQAAPRTMRGVFAFLHIVEAGAAVALVGFFILIVTGIFPATRSITPIQYSVIDPEGLHAEAQAIDMQIQLADIEYPQVTSTVAGGVTVASPAALTKAFATVLGAQATSSASTSVAAAGESTSTASTTTLSVDQALQQLSH